jgi:3-hydroxybutyryl-CoA dehydrogenase
MKEIHRVMVLGAGVMGHGIALVTARSGIRTDLMDMDQAYLDEALSKIDRFLKGSVDRKKMTEEEARDTRERISVTTDVREVADGTDLVIEAIVEKKEIKSQVFKELNEICDPSVIFASNTSQLSITELGRLSGRPDRFIGMHWFNPPPLMKLIEIAKGVQTSDETVDVLVALCKRLDKAPFVCKDSPGFVVNRILNVWYNEGMRLVDEGAADVETVDSAIRDGGGFRMGPMQLRDLVGLDTALMIHSSLYETLGNEKFRPCNCLRDRVAAGHFGRKTGKGFYEYDSD